MFIREKKIICKNYIEIDIIPKIKEDEFFKKRKRKEYISRPSQEALNEKNSKRYFVQLCNGNFTNQDIHLSLTYSNKYLPSTVEEAEKEVEKYLRRIKYLRKKRGLENLKYILVTEYGESKRIHHHLIMNGGIERDELENLWSKKNEKGNKEKIGYINADRLQFDGMTGITGLALYLTKDPRNRKKGNKEKIKGKKRWSSSRNLIRPYMSKNDHKFSKKTINFLASINDKGNYFKELYQQNDIKIIDVQCVYFDETGWHFYLKGWIEKSKKIKRE